MYVQQNNQVKIIEICFKEYKKYDFCNFFSFFQKNKNVDPFQQYYKNTKQLQSIQIMIKKILSITVIMVLIFQGTAIDLPEGTVYLKADNGQYLSICHYCGNGAYADSASVSCRQPWTLQMVGNQVAFRGVNGNYLSRCNGCWLGGVRPDSAFVHAQTYAYPWALWTPILLSNGKYVFKSDNGKYLARCYGCVPKAITSNFAFVHETNSSAPWAQWEVIYADLPPLGSYTFQADDGLYLKVCSGCEKNNAVSVQAGAVYWNIERVGKKVAISGSNGKYLSRCYGCWPNAVYSDSAFAHMTNYNGAFSQWTPIRLPFGKWAFKSDTGKYLARCYGCTKSNKVNLAFVHSDSMFDPWAQWYLS